MEIRIPQIRNGECYNDYETEYFLAQRLAKNNDTLPFPVLSPLSEDPISDMLSIHAGNKELQKNKPQIAIPVSLDNGCYAGLFIRAEEKVGGKPEEYEYKAIWADPTGVDSMPKYVKEMLKSSLGISSENIFVSKSRYQPVELKDLPESDEPDSESMDVEEPVKKQVFVTDNNSAPFVVEILKKLSSHEMYLEFDEASNQLKLHKTKNNQPIKEMNEEESAKAVDPLRKKHLSLYKPEPVEKSTEHKNSKAKAAGFSFVGGLKAIGTLVLTMGSAAAVEMSTNPVSFPTLAPSNGDKLSAPTLKPSFIPFGSKFGESSIQFPPIGPILKNPSFRPSQFPTSDPSKFPTLAPSKFPTLAPSKFPTLAPSNSDQYSFAPTLLPTFSPSTQPSSQPSAQPSSQPSAQPSSQPSAQPFQYPTSIPTSNPSNQPSAQPFQYPTSIPTSDPSAQPSAQPFQYPTSIPTGFPSISPTSAPSGNITSSERYPTNVLPNEVTASLVGFGAGSITQIGAIMCAKTPFLDGALFAAKEAALECVGPISATALAVAGHTLIGGAFGAGIGAAAAAIHNEVERKSRSNQAEQDLSETKAREGQGWGGEDERVREWAYLGAVAGGVFTVTAMAAVAIERCRKKDHTKVFVYDDDIEVEFRGGFSGDVFGR